MYCVFRSIFCPSYWHQAVFARILLKIKVYALGTQYYYIIVPIYYNINIVFYINKNRNDSDSDSPILRIRDIIL